MDTNDNKQNDKEQSELLERILKSLQGTQKEYLKVTRWADVPDEFWKLWKKEKEKIKTLKFSVKKEADKFTVYRIDKDDIKN